MEQTKPALFDDIPKDVVAELLLHVFRQMNETLAETDDGLVACPGLGQFRVKKVESESSGKKILHRSVSLRRVERIDNDIRESKIPETQS